MASVFTSRVTLELSLPSDPAQSITIRKLNPKSLQAAQRAAQQESMEGLKAMGGAAFMKELQQLQVKDPEVAKATIADPLLQYDRGVLIEKGVTAWTLDAPLGPESIEDLDDETQDWLAREILTLAKPSAFQTEAEVEAARKND